MNQAARFRRLLEDGQMVIAPGAGDVLTARLVLQAGFSAVYMTGFGATASLLGTPDVGLLTQTEMVTHARNMARAVDLPVIADADTGYGGPANIERTVHEYELAGVAAIHLEDQTSPKRCGQMSGIKLISSDEMVLKLKCAIAARRDSGLVIIGRTDALPAVGISEATRRAEAYAEAGVDIVFVDGIKKVDDLKAIGKAIDSPLMVSIVDGNETTRLTIDELSDMGFEIVIYPLSTLLSSSLAVKELLDELKDTGSTHSRQNQMMSYTEFTHIVKHDHYGALDEKFGFN